MKNTKKSVFNVTLIINSVSVYTFPFLHIMKRSCNIIYIPDYVVLKIFLCPNLTVCISLLVCPAHVWSFFEVFNERDLCITVKFIKLPQNNEKSLLFTKSCIRFLRLIIICPHWMMIYFWKHDTFISYTCYNCLLGNS